MVVEEKKWKDGRGPLQKPDLDRLQKLQSFCACTGTRLGDRGDRASRSDALNSLNCAGLVACANQMTGAAESAEHQILHCGSESSCALHPRPQVRVARACGLLAAKIQDFVQFSPPRTTTTNPKDHHPNALLFFSTLTTRRQPVPGREIQHV